MSQSPYGAKWLATTRTGTSSVSATPVGRNPLTGLSGLQQDGNVMSNIASYYRVSQSPYGAKWFATGDAS
jgi:hypothetical protein